MYCTFTFTFDHHLKFLLSSLSFFACNYDNPLGRVFYQDTNYVRIPKILEYKYMGVLPYTAEKVVS